MKSILIAALLLGAVPKTLEPQTLELDRDRLERNEDLSESLANQLLAMSVAVRRQDLTEVASSFPATDPLEATPFPEQPGPDALVVKWIERHEWNLDTEASTMPASELLSSLEAFLGHFESIDDVRFKVKNAEFEPKEPATGRAKIFFVLVGRNHDGEREWVRGWSDVRATQRPDETWRIDYWRWSELDSMMSTRDLFSEITEPLGMWEDVPRFGDPPNDGFVAHGAAVADVDLDGRLDVFTSGVMANRLFLNRGGGKPFEDVSEETLVFLGNYILYYTPVRRTCATIGTGYSFNDGRSKRTGNREPHDSAKFHTKRTDCRSQRTRYGTWPPSSRRGTGRRLLEKTCE